MVHTILVSAVLGIRYAVIICWWQWWDDNPLQFLVAVLGYEGPLQILMAVVGYGPYNFGFSGALGYDMPL